jgi:hypothetical protein
MPPPSGEPSAPPQSAEDNAGVGTVAWENLPAGLEEGETHARAELSGGQSTHYYKATNPGFAIPEGAAIRGISTRFLRSAGGSPERIFDNRVRLIKSGSVQSAEDKASSEPWPFTSTSVEAVYGGDGDLWSNSWTPANVNSSGFGVAISAKAGEFGSQARFRGLMITVYYTEESDENRICFQTRSVEPRSDGVQRQAPSDEVWGRLVPDDGSYPTATPGGLEDRPTRTVVIPSAGDLATLPDAAELGLVSASTFARDGFHLAREGAP